MSGEPVAGGAVAVLAVRGAVQVGVRRRGRRVRRGGPVAPQAQLGPVRRGVFVTGGEPFLYPGAVTALIRDYLERALRGEAGREDPLTARELEVVKLIAEGYTSDEIAAELVISRKTVDHGADRQVIHVSVGRSRCRG